MYRIPHCSKVERSTSSLSRFFQTIVSFILPARSRVAFTVFRPRHAPVAPASWPHLETKGRGRLRLVRVVARFQICSPSNPSCRPLWSEHRAVCWPRPRAPVTTMQTAVVSARLNIPPPSPRLVGGRVERESPLVPDVACLTLLDLRSAFSRNADIAAPGGIVLTLLIAPLVRLGGALALLPPNQPRPSSAADATLA